MLTGGHANMLTGGHADMLTGGHADKLTGGEICNEIERRLEGKGKKLRLVDYPVLRKAAKRA